MKLYDVKQLPELEKRFQDVLFNQNWIIFGLTPDGEQSSKLVGF